MKSDDNFGIYVKVNGNTPEDLDKALKKLKRKVKKSNLLIEYGDAQFYKKPSDEKREKRIKAKIRNKYKLLEESEEESTRMR